jgi:general secretion pathway protein F
MAAGVDSRLAEEVRWLGTDSGFTMAVFAYKALDARGRRQTGTLAADTPVEGRQILRKHGWCIEHFAPAAGTMARASRLRWARLRAIGNRSRRADRVADSARELALLLRTGVPLADGLDVLIRQYKPGRWQAVLRDIRDRVATGLSLADAMQAHAGWFDALFLSAVRVGQQAGALDQALSQLAAFLKERRRLASRLTAALVYPLILLVLGIGVTLFLMTYVIPQLLTVLQASGRPLPAPTALLKAGSDALIQFWPWIGLGGLLLAGAGSAVLRTEPGKRQCHRLVLRLPLVGPLIRKTLVARFAQQMAMLLTSGIPFTEAVATVRQGSRNVVLADELRAIGDAVQAGSDIAPTLSHSRVFPPLVVHLVAVGQDAGELTEILTQLKIGYETEVELAIGKFTSALEPLLIVVMASVIGFVIFATVLPILEATRALQ